MRTLITGARGFIGSAIARSALNAGHSVAVMVRPGATPGRLRDMSSDVTWIYSNLAALASSRTRAAFASFAPDVVVHAGWEGVSGAERNAPWQVTRNVPAALDLLTRSAESGATHFIGLGSQAEYGPCSGRITEDQPLSPTTLYGVAKVSASVATRNAAQSRGLTHSWLRVFSTYGAGGDANWVLPMAASAIARGLAPRLTPCEQRWEFLHVTDAANAVIAVAEHNAAGTFNLGSGDARTLRDVINALRDRIDPAMVPLFGEVAYRPDQVMHLEADIARLQTATNWSPKISLAAGLEELAREALEQHRLPAHA